MKVKICGLANIIDAKVALKAGADLLGFVMGGHVFPVEVEPQAQKVREIIKFVQKKAEAVLVTHLQATDDILALADYINSTAIQISEDIEHQELLRLRNSTERVIIKTIPVDDSYKIQINKYEPYCDYFLLDSKIAGYVGGTGHTSDWDLCKKIIKSTKKPTFLAGGLTPENVHTAIQKTNPFGVDVSTGVSHYSSNYLKKDRKDPNKIKSFITNAKIV